MNDFSDWDVIDTYSTKQAVEDGYLVRIDQKISKEAGIKYPVYLTRAVWDKYVSVPRGFQKVQDVDGRLWDVLYMFAVVARTCDKQLLMFQLNVKLPCTLNWESNEKRDPELSDKHNTRIVTLKSVIQPQDFDDPSPAIFIMKPSED